MKKRKNLKTCNPRRELFGAHEQRATVQATNRNFRLINFCYFSSYILVLLIQWHFFFVVKLLD